MHAYLLASTARPLHFDRTTRVGGHDKLGELRVEAAIQVRVGRALHGADIRNKTDRAWT